MENLGLKTNELSDCQIAQLVTLFNRVFDRNVEKEFLISQYTKNPFGYSYHTLAIDSGRIVGHSAYIPAWFWYKDEKVIFACSGDTMIEKEYRDFFTFYDMSCEAGRLLKKEGVAMCYGYPNDNSFPVVMKAKLAKHIGRMNIYCLPYRIGGIKKSWGWLNPLSICFCRLWVKMNSVVASDKIAVFPIYKDNESFNLTRYSRFDGNYGHIAEKGMEAYYKIKVQEGVRTAFIIDVFPKSARNYVKVVNYILKKESSNFDLILYPGFLPFSNIGLIKLPVKMEPKNFNMTGSIYRKDLLDEKIVFDIRNWDTNLSNYDLI